jgi:shikimate kinase
VNIYLVGYRGTGKTSVAPILAQLLGSPWQPIDMDPLLEHEAGVSIRKIFQHEGEAGFRDREARLLERLDQQDHLVVATGGGVIERPENRERLAGKFVIWLRCQPQTIERRLALDPTTEERRPNLTAQGVTATGGLAEIEQILARRVPLYQEVASLALDTDELPPDAIARAIVPSLLREGSA